MKRIHRHIIFAVLAVCGSMAAAASPNDRFGQDDIAAVERVDPQVATGSQCIEITVADNESHEGAIYALTGQLVKHVAITEGKTHIELKPGYYIVRIDGQSKRVVVK